ncbi:hypothetical protein [Sinorhizobium meliloti]|uniref:hypothetical protein n=1 Tax=Rhizobium meliloti TaxID=382 RepID=UPI001F37E762|nr:hypothetical protein [Sinorhizobium meliloti]
MYYASPLDRQHLLRKRAAHRIIARCLRGDRGEFLMEKARIALSEMERSDGPTPYVRGWQDLFSGDRFDVARRIVMRDEAAEDLRETSPFMKLHGFDYGRRMSIVFMDEGSEAKGAYRSAERHSGHYIAAPAFKSQNLRAAGGDLAGESLRIIRVRELPLKQEYRRGIVDRNALHRYVGMGCRTAQNVCQQGH